MAIAFQEIKRGEHCPVCSKPRRCKFAIGDPDNVRLCFRVADEQVNGFRRIKHTDQCATYIRVGSAANGNGRMDRTDKRVDDGADLDAVARRYREGITEEQVKRFASELGVTVISLRSIDVGHNGQDSCFPERDAQGHVVAINRRTGDGRKLVGKGQHRGLIVPNDLAKRPDPVLIVEGPSDTAAALTMGLTVVGRPMAKGGAESLAELLRERSVIVVGENDAKDNGDWPGRDGAVAIASALARRWAKAVAWALPPDEAKDVRDFLQQHAGDPVKAGETMLRHLTEHTEHEEPTYGGGYTELWLAERLVQRHGRDLHYSLTHGWQVWDGTRWKRDDSGEVERRAKETVRSLYAGAAKIGDDTKRTALIDFARRCERAGRLVNIVTLARSEKPIPITADRHDVDPWLFNCQNGVIDLRNGKLRPHRRDDLITKLAPVAYDPKATHWNWLAFLRMILHSNEELVTFLQRAVGYSLSGDTSERCLFVLHGTGRNGKTTFLETVSELLGDYALRTPTETLMIKHGGTIPNDVARLKGARFVTASESDEGARLAEGVIKDLTGGDKLAARHMRCEWFDFTPECKLWLGTNHRPLIRGTDDAIWDRVRLLPFNVRIENPKPRREIAAIFRAELPGILAWAVEGCLAWQREGLTTPDPVRAAVAAYRHDEDVLGLFIEERCLIGTDFQVASADLYDAYVAWTGKKSWSRTAFGRALKERSFDNRRWGSAQRMYWFGIGLAEGLEGLVPDSPLSAS